jgi:hypothetical protein
VAPSPLPVHPHTVLRKCKSGASEILQIRQTVRGKTDKVLGSYGIHGGIARERGWHANCLSGSRCRESPTIGFAHGRKLQ